MIGDLKSKIVPLKKSNWNDDKDRKKAWNVLLCIPRENKSQFGCSVWYRTCYCLVAGFDVLWFIYLLVGVIIIVILVLIIFCCMWRRWLVIFIFRQFLVCNFALALNHPTQWSCCAKEHPVLSQINVLKLKFGTSFIKHLTVFIAAVEILPIVPCMKTRMPSCKKRMSQKHHSHLILKRIPTS